MKTESPAKTINIKVDYLARVEGEGGLHIKMRAGVVKEVQFRIFEPPRFFEAFLRGRHFTEAPDITARICGICPVAYQMSAVQALENAFGVNIGTPLRALRRLLYCGEWIESHALHIYMLHAPDFLGCQDVIQMAKEHLGHIERGLQLKKTGNEIMSVIGGREIHPVNVRVGGFYRAPSRRELEPVAERLKWARDTALETVSWVASFPFPDFERDYEFVSLSHPAEYPLNEGTITSNKGLHIKASAYDAHFTEDHVAHSSALHSTLARKGAYLVGPLARYSLNFARLSALAQEAARNAGLRVTCRNPFQSIIVRAVELVYACDEALRLIAEYEAPDQQAVDMPVRGATGYACTEAPRGMLYHRYRIDELGIIQDARIVPPTSQNQKTIEADLRAFVPDHANLPEEQLKWRCEQAIRNYDPCISCATHAFRIHLDRK